jgi:signal transduction histidine kinase/ligand-binding sensor domain-containing protein
MALLCAAWHLAQWFEAKGAPAESSSPADYLVRNWTTADGIPHNTVRSVIESRDGYLWIGTANGLARFDGARFKVFDAANTPELISDNIFSLYEDRQGTLWLRTRRGLARRVNGHFEFLSPTNGVRPVPFGGMLEDSDGTLWFRGLTGIGRWNGHSIEAVPLPANGPHGIIHLCPAREGGLWLSSSNGLWRLSGGQAELFAKSPIVETLAQGPDGQLWGLVANRQLVNFQNGVWHAVAEISGDNSTTLYAAPNGDVWIGSEMRNAAYRWRAGKMSVFSAAEGLEGVRVLGFVQDQGGNVWIGLNAGGLYRLRERLVQILGREAGFESPNTTSVIELPDGTIEVGVMGSTLHTVRGGTTARRPVQSDDEPFENPTALAGAREGGVWAGKFFGKLPRVVDGRVVEWRGSTNGTRALFVDRDGRLWRGMRQAGIEVFAGTNVTRYGTNDGLSFDNVYCFAQDRDGAVWAGTEQGLNRIQNGRITAFGITNGLGHPYISALCVDSRGMLWVGTLGGGLSGWNGTRFVTLTTREGLAHDAVDQIIEDDFGHLWIGTRFGLMRLSVAELHEFAAGKTRIVTGMLVGRDEGLLRGNLWTEYQPASLKARDGRLWFCTGSGLAVVDPRRFEKPASAPLVHIEEVTVDGHVAAVESRRAAPFVIPPGSERVTIGYTGISPSEPAQVRFRYRLAGYDRDWVEAGRSRVAGYAHLPPGPYQFQVTAGNNDGAWNEAGAVISFDVRPRFWETLWFRSALALALAAMLYAIYWLQLRRVEKRRAAQEAFARQLIASQEGERKRIARELHDSLGQNLLVIKNRAALALTQRSQPEKMVEQVAEVSSMASAAIREVREIAQNLRPFQIDELGLSKSIRAMARTLGDASGIRIDTDLDDVDDALPPEFEINFYRAVQECLNNVVKHSGAKTAAVSLRRGVDALCLTVTDDGRGFVRGKTVHQVDPGFGLSNITERVRTMAGTVEIHSHPGQGARVELRVPLSAVSKPPPARG